MRIYVQSEGVRFFIPVPTALLCSKLSVKLVVFCLRQANKELPFPPEVILAMRDVLRQSRRIHGHLTLVDVESASGDKVKIVL